MRDVGDAVARHVVMVERLAELLRRKDLDLDRAVRGLVDRCGPGFRRRDASDARRHPVREAQLDRLVLRERGAGEQQRGGKRSHSQHVFH